MAATKTDIRQFISRDTLDQLKLLSGEQLDSLMRSTNTELTPPLRLDASNPADLVINVGGSVVSNTENDRKRLVAPIDEAYPTFNGGTITIPSSGSGAVTVTNGNNTTLALTSNFYIRGLIYIDSSYDLNILFGTESATENTANIPEPPARTRAAGFVTLYNNGGTVDAIEQEKLFQFGAGGAGGSASGTANYNAYFNGSGNLASEQYVAKSRGGFGEDATAITDTPAQIQTAVDDVQAAKALDGNSTLVKRSPNGVVELNVSSPGYNYTLTSDYSIATLDTNVLLIDAFGQDRKILNVDASKVNKVTIFNKGTTNNLVLKHENSGIGGDFFFPNEEDYIIYPKESAELYYHSLDGRWTRINGAAQSIIVNGDWPQYLGDGTDFTVSDTNWTTTRAVAVPYKTEDGVWRLRFNIKGSYSTALASSSSLAISGITFKNIATFSQSLSISQFTNGTSAPIKGSAESNSGNISFFFTGNVQVISVSGDVELESKPTWAIDKSIIATPSTEYQMSVATDSLNDLDLSGAAATNHHTITHNFGSIAKGVTISYDLNGTKYKLDPATYIEEENDNKIEFDFSPLASSANNIITINASLHTRPTGLVSDIYVETEDANERVINSNNPVASTWYDVDTTNAKIDLTEGTWEITYNSVVTERSSTSTVRGAQLGISDSTGNTIITKSVSRGLDSASSTSQTNQWWLGKTFIYEATSSVSLYLKTQELNGGGNWNVFKVGRADSPTIIYAKKLTR